jgi:hypothetical protein
MPIKANLTKVRDAKPRVLASSKKQRMISQRIQRSPGCDHNSVREISMRFNENCGTPPSLLGRASRYLAHIACIGLFCTFSPSLLAANDEAGLSMSAFQIEAEGGNSVAQHDLDLMNEAAQPNADYGIEDWESLVKAAEEGDVRAQIDLGYAFLTGDGVTQDSAKARYWMQQAAYQGDAESQLLVGMMYRDGFGGIRDNKLGYAWIGSAVAQGNADAITELSSVRDLLNRRQLAKAEILLERFVTDYVDPYR